MKWVHISTLVPLVILLLEPALPGPSQLTSGTPPVQDSAVTRFQRQPGTLSPAIEPVPGTALAESLDCSGVLGRLTHLYLPVMTRGKSTSLAAAESTLSTGVRINKPATTVGADFADASAFLYRGSAAIQHNLQPQAIDPLRAAVLRGRACTRSGTPLAGVEITILDHPEYGNTLSQADGMFDLAVNGGGPLTLNYVRAGYLPAQRQVSAAPRDYAWLPDVVLIPLDRQVTQINLAQATMQVARGSAVADGDGARQATLLVPQGTAAELVMPDGSTQPVTQLSIRATEYTVGDAGPEAMPGSLPPSSGYTYALEYSVDQAQTAGAAEVRFNQPLIHYVENFLNFPVGMIVPTGYYDRREGAWFPSQNGRVVKMVSVSGGLANLDTDGDGAADNSAALGITVAERQNLAALYSPGQTLWRVPIKHFTPWDCNWPYGPPGGASGPNQSSPQNQPPEDKPTCQTGSIIECQNQILGESIALAGTPFSLNYRSDRVPGRLAAYHLQVPLSGFTLPASLARIDLIIEVSGRRFTQSFPAEPNQSTAFTWDGLDAYGRTVISRQPATVRVGYVYGAVYQEPNQFDEAFAALSGVPISANSARQEITLWQVWNLKIGGWDSRAQGLGGWSLDVHHAYDPVAKVLLLGNGTRRSADSLGTGVIDTFAGGGLVAGPDVGDGGPATRAELSVPVALDVGADGSLYIVESGGHTVRRVDPLGIITTVAGTDHVSCFPSTAACGDGGLATAALLGTPQDVAVGADGSLYIAERTNHRIRHVAPDGIITTVAGTGVMGFGGDGGPATAALLSSPYGLEVGPDGSLYIADRDNSRIRKVGPNGVITTLAGGVYGFAGDGGPAGQARLAQPWQVKLGPDGSLYILDRGNYRIRRVEPNGIISTVAGNGLLGHSGDGGPATQASLSVSEGLAVGPDGSLYIGDHQNYRVRWVGPDGLINTVAGSADFGYSGDGGPATRARLTYPLGVALSPDGRLYIADWANQRVRRITSALPGFSVSDLLLPSEDGLELYVFNGGGRHLRTLHGLTGAVLYEFAYDAGFRLRTVTDGSGNTTLIQHAASGAPTAIVGPDGQTTVLTLDGNGFLARVTNPAGEAHQFTSTAGGLLTALTHPRGFVTTFSYDSLGRLIRDQDPAGGDQTLNRTEVGRAYTVTLRSGLGRTRQFHVETLPDGTEQGVNVMADGTQWHSVEKADATQAWQWPVGIVASAQYGPDPRWGMLAPVNEGLTTTFPSGLTHLRFVTRTATLADSANPLSLSTLTEILRINSAAYTRTFQTASGVQTERSPTGRVISTTINNLGQVIIEQLAGLSPTRYGYDSRGRIISATMGTGAELRNALLTYNAQGDLATFTDALGQTTQYGYDAAGRLTTETRPDGQTVTYAYDANGNLVGLMPPGRPTHTFGYTPVDLMAQYSPPDVNPGVDTTQHFYNADRQLTQTTRPDGETIAYSYDSAGRPSIVTTARGTTTYGYNPTAGTLASISAPGGIGLAYTYDGSLLTGQTWSGPVAGSITHRYDADLRLNELQVNGANPVAYKYDLDGLLVGAGALTLGYNSQNALRVSSALGIITEIHAFNSFAEPVEYRAAAGASGLYAVDYARDALGRIAVLTETLGGVTNVHTYSYNLAGQLTTVAKNGLLLAAYTYDSNGNRLTLTGAGGPLSGLYDSQDRLTQYGSTTYTYNAEGQRQTRTTGGQVTTYAYDALGNLMAAGLPSGTQIAYLVDGQNRRIARLVNGARVQGFLYEDALRIAAELDAANNVVSRFVYATWDNVPDYMIKSGVTYRLLTDHLGSVRLVVNAATGAIAQRLDYDAFGAVLADTNPGFQPFGFAGGLYDADTHLIRFGARDYDAGIGQWTARDPILFDGEQTNLYSYVDNDPINLRDVDGLKHKMFWVPKPKKSAPPKHDQSQCIFVHPHPKKSIPLKYLDLGKLVK